MFLSDLIWTWFVYVKLSSSFTSDGLKQPVAVYCQIVSMFIHPYVY